MLIWRGCTRSTVVAVVVSVVGCGTASSPIGADDAGGGGLRDASGEASAMDASTDASAAGDGCAVPQTWYVDADGDGWGAAAVQFCSPPASGYVLLKGDCDDTDARAYPGQPMFFDTPANGGGFDFDCSGFEQPESQLTAECHSDGASMPQCIGAGNGMAWYAAVAPKCGVTSPWLISCTAQAILGCSIASDTRTQKCK